MCLMLARVSPTITNSAGPTSPSAVIGGGERGASALRDSPVAEVLDVDQVQIAGSVAHSSDNHRPSAGLSSHRPRQPWFTE